MTKHTACGWSEQLPQRVGTDAISPCPRHNGHTFCDVVIDELLSASAVPVRTRGRTSVSQSSYIRACKIMRTRSIADDVLIFEWTCSVATVDKPSLEDEKHDGKSAEKVEQKSMPVADVVDGISRNKAPVLVLGTASVLQRSGQHFYHNVVVSLQVLLSAWQSNSLLRTPQN